MIIFSHTLTPRLQYVVDFLSKYYGTPIRIICDDEKYLANPDPFKINYSFHRLSNNEIWINAHVLLFETAVRHVKIECFTQTALSSSKGAYKAFFKTEGDFGFDILAAIFFLITRYEEYLPHKKDIFGRYAHENSLAFNEDFLHQPLVNTWLNDFAELLKQRFPELKLNLPGFSFLPTYDIDMAWSFKNKGFNRNAGAILKLFFTARWGKMLRRIKVLRRKRDDPHDAYQWMDNLHSKFSLKPIYFFLVAQQTGKYDKNIDVNNPEFRSLIESINLNYKIGLHPSFASSENATLLPKEKATLEDIVGHPVHSSRQHYITLDFPTTYRRLITLGITEDYSMGYGGINGFRASIATPFSWYDLKNEMQTSLTVYPFCFMEATSYYEQKITSEEALNDLMHYYEAVKKVGGTLITIWHNGFLGTDSEFNGWRDAYERFVQNVAAAR